MRFKHIHFLTLALTLAALAIFIYKWRVIGLPITPGEHTAAWEVETRISLEAQGGPVKVLSFFPESSGPIAILDKRYIATGYGLSEKKEKNNRLISLETRQAVGLQVLHIRFTVHRFHSTEDEHPAPAAKPERPALEGSRLAAAREILATARQQSAGESGVVTGVVKQLGSNSPSDAVKELLGSKTTPAARGDAASAILALDQITASRVNGLDLAREGTAVNIIHWLEAYVDGRWISYSLFDGNPEIPELAFPWWRGAAPLVQVRGGRKTEHLISLVQLEERILDRILSSGENRQDEWLSFSLFSLPLATQNVYRILMVIPVGIFLLVIIRNIIGLRSLGTFMPVLIALAFRETNLAWGLVLFTTIVGCGLLFRFYLERLQLLLVPRLASVSIFVILVMAMISIVTHKLGFVRGISIALFPMVIMTMTIERVSVIWDERGAAEAILQALGSLAIASLCYLVMMIDAIEYLCFTFPELLLVLLAATLLIGRYTGYRLMELKRFRVLADKGA